MDSLTTPEQRAASRYIEEEANAAVLRGARYAAVFGMGSGVIVALLIAIGLLKGVELASGFAFLAGAYAWLLHAFAKRKALVGWKVYALFLPFVSLPTAFFLSAELFMPFGVATWLPGPFSYLYLNLIVITGFFFNARLSRFAGWVAAVEYTGCILLARPYLARIHVDDPTALQDLASTEIYLLRATMMLLCGYLVGALATTARKLILRVMQEEREKQGLSRLFGQFVSPEVKEKLIAQKAGVVGERKQVVVLFSDLRSFTSHSEGADPEALVHHLNEYFDGMVGCITSRGGVIDKFMGDAVMAVFGGVIPLDSPAEAALDAAIAMRAKLDELNVGWRARGMPTFDNGIGMHFGEVLQGTVGSADRKEFTVIGDAVNTASRLESITKDLPHPICASSAFVEALPPARRAECVSLGLRRLKGKQQEVEIFGVPDRRAREDAA